VNKAQNDSSETQKPACLWLVACVVRREIGVAKGGGGGGGGGDRQVRQCLDPPVLRVSDSSVLVVIIIDRPLSVLFLFSTSHSFPPHKSSV